MYQERKGGHIMALRTERVTRLIENFFDEWQKGKNISEIALEYRVSTQTIYDNLQKIADFNGVSRDTLLEKPHISHQKRTAQYERQKFEKVSFEEIQEQFKDLIFHTEGLIKKIDSKLRED